MVNKPKQKGTAAETAVVEWLRLNGHPWAERRSLKGSLDKGDVTGIPGICIEVKAGSILNLAGWLRETRIETANSGAKHGILVVKPIGFGIRRVDKWWAAMYVGDFDMLSWEQTHSDRDKVVEMVSGARNISTEVMRVLATKDIAIVSARSAEPDMFYAVTTLELINGMLLRAGYGDLPMIERTEVEDA